MTLITDFDPAEGFVVLAPGPGSTLDIDTVSIRVLDDGTDADVPIDDIVTARVIGGQDLTVADITFDSALFNNDPRRA